MFKCFKICAFSVVFAFLCMISMDGKVLAKPGFDGIDEHGHRVNVVDVATYLKKNPYNPPKALSKPKPASKKTVPKKVAPKKEEPKSKAVAAPVARMDEDAIRRIVDERVEQKLREERRPSAGKVVNAMAMGAIGGSIMGALGGSVAGPAGVVVGAGAMAVDGAVTGAISTGVAELAIGWWNQ